MLSKVEDQVDRASTIINNLLHFSHRSARAKSDVDFNSLVGDSLSLLENQLNYPKVRITTELSGNLNIILGDRINLQQVVINLLLNAKDSMPDGGEIRIETRNDGSGIICKVTDEGIGISKEIQNKIFEPFFTTKNIGQGTGLGLSVSYRIIQEHKGSIEVESEVGIGTKFEIYLPGPEHNSG